MLYIGIILFLFVYQLYKKDNKFVGFAGLIYLGYLGGTVSYHVNDYLVYNINYNQVGINGMSALYFEKGYSLLGYFCYKLGMGYSQFRLFFAILISIVLFLGIIRFTSNVCLFASVYGGTLFLTDAIQIRSFMTIALVILGISFLKEINFKNVVISSLIILLSAQFQSLGYLFLSIILIRIFIDKKLHLKFLFPSSLVLYLIFVVLGRSTISKLIGELASFTGGRINLQEKITTQYVLGASARTLIAVFVLTWLMVLLSTYFIKKVYVNNIPNIIKLLYSAILSSLFVLPFTYLAIDYARYSRGCMVIFVIFICVIIPKLNVLNSHVKITLIFSTFMLLICSGFYFNSMWGHAFLNSIPYIIKWEYLGA